MLVGLALTTNIVQKTSDILCSCLKYCHHEDSQNAANNIRAKANSALAASPDGLPFFVFSRTFVTLLAASNKSMGWGTTAVHNAMPKLAAHIQARRTHALLNQAAIISSCAYCHVVISGRRFALPIGG